MPNLAKRLLSAAVIVPGSLAVALLGPAWSIAALVTALAAICGYEFAAMALGGRGAAFRALYGAMCGLVCAAVSLASAVPSAPLGALLAAAPAGLLLHLRASPAAPEPPASVQGAALAALGLVYCGALPGSIALLYPAASLSDPAASPAPPEGRLWIVLLLAGVVASDTFAYACGRLFGVRKLAPRISPGKTWAGAVGSLAGTPVAVTAFALAFLPGLHPAAAAGLGLALSVFGQLGDLCESLLKRGFSVKDSGNLIPGHGGVLDRLDSFLFCAPVVLLFSRLW